MRNATIALLAGASVLAAFALQPTEPSILRGTGCGPNKQTLYFAEEDQFPVCENIRRIRG